MLSNLWLRMSLVKMRNEDKSLVSLLNASNKDRSRITLITSGSSLKNNRFCQWKQKQGHCAARSDQEYGFSVLKYFVSMTGETVLTEFLTVYLLYYILIYNILEICNGIKMRKLRTERQIVNITVNWLYCFHYEMFLFQEIWTENSNKTCLCSSLWCVRKWKKTISQF